jgi:hypothetical protein
VLEVAASGLRGGEATLALACQYYPSSRSELS